MTFYTRWSNVVAVREGRWEATLILAQPARSEYGPLFTYLPGARVRQLHNRTIPLSNYGWFHDSQLRQEVHHYVPHLLHTSG